MEKEISSFIEKRKSLGQYRQLKTAHSSAATEICIGSRTFVNFCSNDYLGLSKNRRLKEKAIEYIEKYGAGAGASRLVCGNYSFHEEVENRIAELSGFPGCLLFPSGYQANSTIISSLADRETIIFADKHCHNSILAGASASKGRLVRYRHNDLEHLGALLAQNVHSKRKIIISESIFSMDGDLADLKALGELSKEYQALLYIDDAHATGLFGPNGIGLAFEERSADIVVGTFGKAGGGQGAFCACSSVMKNYLVQTCPGFIYSTAIAPSVVGAMMGFLELLPSLEEKRQRLQVLAKYTGEQIRGLGYDVGKAGAQIMPILAGSEEKSLAMAKKLEDEGILVLPIRPPTVPADSSRLRITLSSDHTDEQVQRLIQSLRSLG